MEARKRAEQEARIRETQRKAAEQRLRDAQQKRFKSEQDARIQEMRRREQYTVKKGDDAGKIAQKLGTTIQNIASQTQGALRAGQVQEYEVPVADLSQYNQQRRIGYRGKPQPFLGDPTKNAIMVENVSNAVEGFINFLGGFGVGTVQANLALPQAPGVSGQQMLNQGPFAGASSNSPFMQAFGDTAFSTPQDLYDTSTFEEATPWSYNVSPEEMKAITDRTRDIEMKQTLQRTYADIKRHEDELYEATIGLRAKTHGALYAWETGDFSVRPDFFTEWEWDQLSPENKRRYQEDLGYVWDDVAGVWVPQDLEEQGYGMGGWDYGDYGGYGGGGGGGDYKPPIYTGANRGFDQGNRSRVNADRLTSSYIPASHWRI